MAFISQCCCGFSLKTGTIIIAILYMSWSIVAIAVISYRSHNLYHIENVTTDIDSTHQLKNETGHSAQNISAWYKQLTPKIVIATRTLLIVDVVLAIIHGISGALLLYGAIKEIPDILFAWVVVETLSVIASVVIEIFTFTAVLTPETVDASIAGMVFSALHVLVAAHFLLVVHSFWLKLRGKKEPRDPVAAGGDGVVYYYD